MLFFNAKYKYLQKQRKKIEKMKRACKAICYTGLPLLFLGKQSLIISDIFRKMLLIPPDILIIFHFYFSFQWADMAF